MASLLAHHLHHSNQRLVVFNRTASKTDDFVASHHGCTKADNAKDLPVQCHITFSCLANDEALKTVFHDFLDGLPTVGSGNSNDDVSSTPYTIYVDCSTVLPSTTRHLAALAAEHRVTYCHCPVFGRPDAAAAGMLKAYLSGGSHADRQAVAGLVGSTYAQMNGVTDLGDDPSTASAMKLIGNFFIAGNIELASETLAFGEKAGLPHSALLGLMGHVSESGIAHGYARRIAAAEYDVGKGFTVDLAVKDVSHMQELAREVSCPVPMASLVMDHLLSARARHGGQLDWGAIGLAVRDMAGLDKPSTSGQ